ncbi:MAG: hypothetical protein QXE96_04085 [Candidatus Caldarchaeum sp.]
MRIVELVKDDAEADVLLADPVSLRALSTPTAWKVLRAFVDDNYISRAASQTGLSKQLVSMHVTRLVRAGLLKEVGGSVHRGGYARIYRTTSSGLAFVYSRRCWKKNHQARRMPEQLAKFLTPIITDGILDGLVVVGSPHPHGPFRAVATDGHYGFQLGLFLGKYIASQKDFAVRLDVDVKSEKLYTENLLLIGGPGTNLITAEINKEMPIYFLENNYWGGLVSPKAVYTSEFTGLVAKTVNPFNQSKQVIVLAGLRAAGTKAAVIALTNHWQSLLSSYTGQERWAAVVEGLDLDGDGKIDSVNVLETA